MSHTKAFVCFVNVTTKIKFIRSCETINFDLLQSFCGFVFEINRPMGIKIKTVVCYTWDLVSLKIVFFKSVLSTNCMHALHNEIIKKKRSLFFLTLISS